MPLTPTTLIKARLTELAAQHHIKIIYACESGSRAWGFPSPDSDYDVRFIYARPWAGYLSLAEGRDVIDLPLEDSAAGVLDIGGWDVRKTLRLAGKSNPVIWEWLQSPMVYQPLAAAELQALNARLAPFYSPIAACHHYLSLCRGTMTRELQDSTVKIKKYFYMLRPLLAAAWIERHHSVPPIGLAPLLALLDGQTQITASIDELLARKQHTDEAIPIPRLAVLDGFLVSELTRLQAAAKTLPTAYGDPAQLDSLFRQLIGAPDPAL
ncbi:MAG: nucleotidyltransferase domain-containing protein [Methylovulum sp.]|nr:nucleotidyltransferase domain-containing protein [Methylovulum sp.]